MIALLFAAAISVILFLNDILFPFILACFLAYVLSPVIHYMHQWRINNRPFPRGLAVVLVYIVVLGTIGGGGAYMVPNLSTEISQMVQEFPDALNQATDKWLPKVNEQLNKWITLFPAPAEKKELRDLPPSPPPTLASRPPIEPEPEPDPFVGVLEDYTYEIVTNDSGNMEVIPHRRTEEEAPKKSSPLDLREHLLSALQTGVERIQENTINFLNLGRQILIQIAGSVFSLFLTLMISAFILVDIDRIFRFGRSLVKSEFHKGYEKFLSKLDHGLNGVVRGQIIICLINGTLTGVGLLIFGVPFVFTLSLVATICSLIPIFGTFLSSFPIVIMALTVSFPTALMIIGWILFIHFIEGNILNPKIIGTSAEIHPALVVFALVAGEYVAGIAGALLAVPVFSILQTTFLFLKSMIEDIEPASS